MGYNAVGEGDLDRVFITNAELVDQYVGQKLYSWGRNDSYQLADGTQSSRFSPISIAGGGSTWKSIAPPISTDSCKVAGAVKTDGTLWMWGYDGYGFGALGRGIANDYTASPITTAGGGTNWDSISVGNNHVAGIKTDGTLWTWGNGSWGRLGNNAISAISSPATIAGGGNNWKQVSCGFRNSAAIKGDSTLWTWGGNNYGECGDWTLGSATSRLSPAVVVGPPALKDASSFRKDIKLSATTAPVKSNFKKFDNETMYFDGSGYLTVPCTTNSTPYGTENWTIEFWMYATSAGSYGIMELPGSVSLGMVNGVAPMVMWNGIQANGMGYYNNVFQNRWVHLAAVKNGTTFTFYVNGQTNGTSTIASTNFPTSDITIGYASQMGNFYGYLDQVRIIKGVAKYTAAFTPSLYPMFDPISADPYYSNVSLLLKADDVVNAANNNTFVDNSGNNLAITRNGNTTQGSFSPFAVEPGKWSNYFDGTGDYLLTPSNAALTLGTGDFTIECWYNKQSEYVGDYHSILGIGARPVSSIVLFANYGGDKKFRVNIPYVKDITTNVSLEIGKWYHIAVSRISGNLYVYLNGSLVASDTLTNDLTHSQVVIGRAYTNNDSEYINGYISNVRIIKGVGLYSGSTIAVPTVPLTAVAGTSLLTCQDNRFVDNSINNFALTPANDVKSVPTSPFSKNTDILAPYFNGSTDSLTITSTTNLTLSGDFTVECWFNKVSGGGNGCIFDIWPMRIFTNGTSVEVWEGGSRNFYAQNSILFNNWNHIAIVRSGTTITAYLNGTSFGSYTSSTSFNGNVVIAYEDSQALNGYVSDFRIVKGTAVYTSNFTPSTQPLKAIANTSLLTCQSDTVDNSSNRYTVTKGGSVNVMPVVPYESPTGNSVYFDGTGDYLTFNNTAWGTSDYTVEFWAYKNVVDNSTRVLCDFRNWGGSPSGTAFALYWNSGGGLEMNGIGGSSATYFSSFAWHHIAVTRSGTTVRCFIDGVLSASGTDSNNYSTGYLSFIGAQTGGAVPWNGYISNLRVVVGTALYTSAFTPPKINLAPIANTVLLTCQDKTIKDNSTNNFTITAYGDAKPAQFGPFKPSDYYFGGSMYFDGTGDYLTAPSGTAFDFGTGDWTVEGWQYFTGIPTPDSDGTRAHTLFSVASAAVGTYGFAMTLSVDASGNGTSFGIGKNTNTSQNITASVSTTMNTWYHFAACKSGNNVYLFVNGTQVGTTTTSTTAWGNSTDIPKVGRLWNSNYMYEMVGYISNLRVVKGTALYTAAFTPPTKPALPVANTSLLLSGTNAGIVDSTGRNNLETVNNAQISTNYRKWNTGSVYFDGSSYLKFPAITFASDYTLEAWVYPTNENLSQQIFSSTASNTQFIINLTYQGSVGIAINGGVVISASGSAVKTNQWNHIAWVREGSVSKVFVNGILQGTGGAGGIFSLDVMGFWGAGGGYYVNGYIDDIRITNGVARYTKNFSVTSKPLSVVTNPVATTSLLTCQSSTIVDNSTNAFTITTYGDTKVSTFAPFLGTNSVYFDGTGDYLTLSSNNAFAYGTGDFTWEMWIYPMNSTWGSTQNFLIDHGSGWGGSLAYASALRYFNTSITDAGGYWLKTGSPNATIPLNTWTHVAAVRSSGTTTVYINGNAKVSGLDPMNYVAQSVTIGNYGGGGAYNFQGYISNLRIVKGQALYTSDFTLGDVPNPPVRSLPARYVAPDANYSSVGLQMNPNEIVNLDYSGGWKQVSTHAAQVLGLKTDGTVWSWGYGGTAIPTQMTYLGNTVKQISQGNNHRAAVKTDGTLWTWGVNDYGQLGDGTITNKTTSPVTMVSGGTNWKQVSCGYKHTVGLKTDGTVWTCGYNAWGQLGDGTTVSKSSPIKILTGNISNWKSVYAGLGVSSGIAQD